MLPLLPGMVGSLRFPAEGRATAEEKRNRGEVRRLG
jgi:hypothetical protein